MDLEKSVAAYTRQWEGDPEFIKIEEDLERYQLVIERTEPEVIVETGTYTGKSAVWFTNLGPEVITIDIDHSHIRGLQPGVRYFYGSSVDLNVVRIAFELTHDKRTMVVLDSDHAAMHVAREIELYGPMVTPGCYMVVEDGIAPWATPCAGDPGPIAAVVNLLSENPDWVHDDKLQDLHPVTMNLLGWWQRAV